MVRQEMQDYQKEQKNRLNEEKPTIKQSVALKGASHKRMGNQKTTHAIRCQGWTVEWQTSLLTMANAWAADKFWTYIEVEHAQGPDTTRLYLANTGSGGL